MVNKCCNFCAVTLAYTYTYSYLISLYLPASRLVLIFFEQRHWVPMHFYTFLAGRSTNTSLTNTEAFATMLGQEIVSKYHLQSQLESSKSSVTAPATPTTPVSGGGVLTNGIGLMAFERGSSPPSHLTPPAAHSNSYRSPASHSGLSSQDLRTESPSHTQRSVTSTPSRSETNTSQVLDTADVSQKIREILSTHNIGQRLFAKHVLGLSQGTVSELLSKPKHWDKLTEKGRESYRKMHAWATDENNVANLKAISPKKG